MRGCFQADCFYLGLCHSSTRSPLITTTLDSVACTNSTMRSNSSLSRRMLSLCPSTLYQSFISSGSVAQTSQNSSRVLYIFISISFTGPPSSTRIIHVSSASPTPSIFSSFKEEGSVISEERASAATEERTVTRDPKDSVSPE